MPKRWQALVEEGFRELVAAMEEKPSFPDVLRGQLMPATDDPLGMKLPYDKLEKRHRTLRDARLRELLACFKGKGSKSLARITILQRILDHDFRP